MSKTMTRRKTVNIMRYIAKESVAGGVNRERAAKWYDVSVATIDKLVGKMRGNGLNVKVRAQTKIDYAEVASQIAKQFPALSKKK